MKNFSKKLISVFLILCFLSTSVLGDSALAMTYKHGDQNLAPKTNMSIPQFIEQALLKGFSLSHKAINLFIKADIENFGRIKHKRTITLSGTTLKLIPIRKLHKNTGVFAHLGLSSNNVYVDWDIFHNDPQSLTDIIDHEFSEISQWEDFFNSLKIATSKRRAWLKDHISSPDPRLNGTTFEGLSSLEISKLFHDTAPSIKNVSEKYDSKILEYDYIQKLFTLYSADEIFDNPSFPKDIVLAAKDTTENKLSWIEQNQTDLVGKSIVSLSMEGNMPELGNTEARDANTKGGLGAYQGDKLEGLAQIGMTALGIQPMYSQIRKGKDEKGNEITSYVNYQPLIDAGTIIPVLTGDHALKIWTGSESGSLKAEKDKWPDKFPSWSGNVEIDVEVYKVNRGGTWVYMLKSDVFDVLYNDTRLDRFIQETVFGKAAFALMKKLDIHPDILHLNEAHTVVAAAQMRADKSYDNTAIVYTNHTIVPAGLEKFSPSMLSPNRMMYLMGLPGEQENYFRSKFVRPDGVVDYCHAAYQLADVINAVSDEHAIATASLFKKLYGEAANKPIIGILNGSGSTWKSSELLYAEKDGNIPDKEELYNIHAKQKKEHALNEVKKRTGIQLDPSKPTVWAVRRLVEYKSQYPILRFIVFLMCADKEKTFTKKQLWALWEKYIPDMNQQHDYNRYYNKDIRLVAQSILEALFQDKKKINGLGMQIVIGGPEYESFWVEQFKRWTYDIPLLKNRFVYVPDSDATLLKMQATGADICLTIPRPLEEACGTSDQRTAMNGGLNIAIKGAGPIEWMSDLREDPINGNGFFLQSYTENEEGINAEVDRFYKECPVDIVNALRFASDTFYNDNPTWKRFMHNAYMASNFGSRGKKAVTAKAMESRYAKDVYSKAINYRKKAIRGKGSPIECLKTMIKNTLYTDTPVTINELISLRNFSRTTVAEEIKILTALGLVQYTGKSNRSKKYGLSPVLKTNTAKIVADLEKIDTLNLYTIADDQFLETLKNVNQILKKHASKEKKNQSPAAKRTVLEKLIVNNHFIDLLERFSSTGKQPSKEEIIAVLHSIDSRKTFDIVIAKNVNITENANEQILLIYFKNSKGRITELLRYAPNEHVDYLSSVRPDPKKTHSANLLSNAHKIELFKDDPKILQKYVQDLKGYHQLREYVHVLNSRDFARITEVINHLRDKYYASRNSSIKRERDIAEYALKLLHSQMYSENYDIRVYANRIMHDIYTQRPASFPTSKTTRTLTHNTPFKVIIPVTKGESKAQIAWSVNGTKKAPIAMNRIRINGKSFFEAIIPVTTGTIHYAVMTKHRDSSWLFKSQLEEACGTIKTQKDVSTTKMLEVRTAIFDVPVDENGNTIKREDGSIEISTLAHLEKQLENLKQEGYNALWLMDCFQWGPIVAPGKDPSSFSPLDHITIAKQLGGEKAFESLMRKAKALNIEIVLNLIPHISRSNQSFSPEIPVYCHSPYGLVQRSSSDGLGDWDDSWHPNWRRKETLDAFAKIAEKFAAKGCSFRADIGHAFDTTFQVDQNAQGLAKLFGDIVSLNKMPDGSFITNDLRGSQEPNAVLSLLAHQIQSRAPNSVIYAENYATHTGHGQMRANDIRLIRSGTIPYSSLHKELIKALRDPSNPDVQGIIDHIGYIQDIYNRFGGQTLISYSSHDYHRNPQEPSAIYQDVPPVQLMQDGIIPFISSILLLSENSGSLWHFARLLGDDADAFSERHNKSLAEFWKCWVNNIREFDFKEAAKASEQFLKDNPHLAHLSEYIHKIENLLSGLSEIGPVKEIEKHGNDCLSFTRQVKDSDQQPKTILTFINYGFHGKEIFRPIADLPELADGELYKISCELSCSRENPSSTKSSVMYMRKEALMNLGIEITLEAWQTIVLSIEPIKDTRHTTALLDGSLSHYKKYSREDRTQYSFAAVSLKESLDIEEDEKSYLSFIETLRKMIEISSRKKAVPLSTISTILYDLSDIYPEHKEKIVDFLTRASIDEKTDIDASTKYEIIKLLRGMHIGEIVLSSLEARGITGLGGLALYIQDIAKAFVSLGIDTTVITWMFSHNKEGNYIFDNVIKDAKLKYTGKSLNIPMDNRNDVTGYVYQTRLQQSNANGGINAIAIFAAELTDVLYGGLTDQDKKDRLEFFAKSSLEAIRTANIYPSVLQGNEVTSLAFKYFKEYGYCASDDHFAKLLTTLFVGHNLERPYRNIINGWDPIADSIHSASDAATVSPGYRQSVLERSHEMGLGDTVPAKEQVDKWHAYQNGIDTVGWQKRILRRESFFTTRNKEKLFEKSMNLKAEAKSRLQESSGFDVNANAPLVTMLHRFTEQKGYEIALPAIKQILASDPTIQIIIGGPAEKDDPLLEQVAEIQRAFPKRFKYLGTQGVNSKLALYEDIYLGADAFMMPSKYEPAGLSQLEAIAAGTPVIAFDIDGLKTSVIDVMEVKDQDNVAATGFKFYNSNFYDAVDDITRTLDRFLNTYYGNENSEIAWTDLVYNCFTYDSRWTNPAKGYVNDIFAKNLGVDLSKIADIPELILIFQHPETDPAYPEKNTIENIEYTLIKYGYITEKGVPYVFAEALQKLKAYSKMKDIHPLAKQKALKYYNKYRNYKQAKQAHNSMSSYAKADCENLISFSEDLSSKLNQQSIKAVYEIRYNQNKLRQIAASKQIESIEALIEEYANVLRYKLGAEVILIPSQNTSDLFSVTRYSDLERTQEYGKGVVDIDASVKDQLLPTVGLLNMAFAASNIKLNTSFDNMNKTEKNILTFIQHQCSLITGKNVAAKDVLAFIKSLPPFKPISLETLAEYNRIALRILASA